LTQILVKKAFFKGTNARSFVVSGSHRYANTTISTCQSGYEVTDDAAHTVNGFHSAVTAILKFYDDDDYTSIQFHGMGSSACPGVDDTYFTHGFGATPPDPLEKIVYFRDALDNINSASHVYFG
jgi:hypothetical protein